MNTITALKCGAAAAALAAVLAPSAAWAQALPSAFTTATRYDVMRRITGTISPDPDGSGALAFAAVRNTYDAAGGLVRVEHGELASWQGESVAPANWTGFTVFRTLDIGYDSMRRKNRETVSGGGAVHAVRQFCYDQRGRLEFTAVRMNPTAFPASTSSSCTAGTPSPTFGPDRIVRNVYDAAGQRLQVREAVGTSLDAAEATWDYNLNGQVTDVIDANGNRAKLAYDGHGRQTRWTFPSATRPAAFNDSTPATALATAGSVNLNDYEAYGHDANGNRTTFRNRSNQQIGYTYDALNRLTAKNLPGTELDVSYSYDLRGLQTGASFNATGQAVLVDYDGFGRIVSTSTTVGGTERTPAFEHDPNGNRTRVTHPDGVFFAYDYDGLNRVTRIRESGAASGIGVLATYNYDNHGRRSRLLRSNGMRAIYAYDTAGRLATLTQTDYGDPHDVAFEFDYNPAGQIVTRWTSNDLYPFTAHSIGSVTDTHNGLNQILTTGGAAATYDARGNMTSDGTRTFAYDSENRLISASGGVSLAYDPSGRLHQVSATAGTARFLYDGDALAAEYDASGNVVRRYVHGPGLDEPVVQYEGSGTSNRRFLHADERGSIVAHSNFWGDGTVVAVNRYDEYGVPQSTNSGRFQYTGQAWLAELGLYYYKARMYHPRIGRFMQVDPIGYDDQMNLYAYVRNDPLRFRDPTGKSTTCAEAMEFCLTTIINNSSVTGGIPIIADNRSALNGFERSAVALRAIYQATAEIAPFNRRRGGGESVYRMDVTEMLGMTMVTTSLVSRGRTSVASVDPDDYVGAEALLHVEPAAVSTGSRRDVGNTGVPGEGDWAVPAMMGLPNMHLFRTNAGAIEIVNGTIRYTPLNYDLSDHGRTAVQDRVNEWQFRGRAY